MGDPPGGRALCGQWSEDILYGAFYFFPFLISAAIDSNDESRSNHPRASGLVFGLTGLVFLAIALAIARRRREAVPGAELI